jgi:hypothetical protein
MIETFGIVTPFLIADVLNPVLFAFMMYAADPAEPKLVPKEQWYAAPAKPPSEPHPG